MLVMDEVFHLNLHDFCTWPFMLSFFFSDGLVQLLWAIEIESCSTLLSDLDKSTPILFFNFS